MIRRSGPDGHFLVTQNAHASVAAQIALHWGNSDFPVPKPKKAVVDAVACHDAGWSLHDSEPTLNAALMPATFYEMPAEYYGRVWVASIAAAAARGGPMGGLIVSWHFTSLARRSPTRKISDYAREVLDRFSRAQRGRQTDYCEALGLSRSLADYTPIAKTDRDRRALYNLDVLGVCDCISIMLCDNAMQEPLLGRVTIDLQSEPEHPINAQWVDKACLRLSPWPLEIPELVLTIPGRYVPLNGYRCDEDLRRAYAEGPAQTIVLSLVS